MRFIQTHATGSDETAPYDVHDFKTNVQEFIDEVLSRRGSWGKILIDGICGKVEYSHGKLLNEIPAEWLDKEITEVKVAGGWGNMDYYLKYNPYKLNYLKGE